MKLRDEFSEFIQIQFSKIKLTITFSVPVILAILSVVSGKSDYIWVTLYLFVIYFLMYAAFIWANVFKHETMMQTKVHIGSSEISLGGPNLAVVSGIGLIFLALVLSLVYMRLTRLPNSETK